MVGMWKLKKKKTVYTPVKTKDVALRVSAEPALERLQKRITDMYGSSSRCKTAVSEFGDIFTGPTLNLRSVGDGLPSVIRKGEGHSKLAHMSAIVYERNEDGMSSDRGVLSVYLDKKMRPAQIKEYIRKMLRDQLLVNLINTDIRLIISVLDLGDPELTYKTSRQMHAIAEVDRHANEELYETIKESVTQTGIEKYMIADTWAISHSAA